MTQPTSQPTTNRFPLQTLSLFLIPVILLAGVIALFLSTGGGPGIKSAAPVGDLSIEGYQLEAHEITLHLRNTRPGPNTIASVIITNAGKPFHVKPGVT